MTKIKQIATLTISELAFIKNCSRQTIYNSYGQFNKTIFAGKEKIIWDDKVDNFNPDQAKIPKKFKEDMQ